MAALPQRCLVWRSRFRRRCATWLAAVWAISCGSCYREPQVPLRIGVSPWPACGYLYLAEELGYLHEEGCNVRLLMFSSLADLQRAYVRNQLHGMYGTATELLQIREQTELRPQIVQVVDFSVGGDVLIGQRRLDSLDMLKRARVGCELGSVSIYLLIRALAEAGLHLSDIELVVCDQYQLEQMFRDQALDAVVTYPPVSLQLAADGTGHVLFSSRDLSHDIFDALLVEESIVQGRTDEIAGLIRAYERAVAYADAHPERAREIMSHYLRIDPDALERTLTHDIRLVRLDDQRNLLESQLLHHVLRNSAAELRLAGQLSAAVAALDCICLEPVLRAAPPSPAELTP